MLTARLVSTRALAQVAAALLAGAAFASCSDDSQGVVELDDGGASDGGVARALCPDATPSAGEVCLLPEGTTCAFQGCGAGFAQCVGSRWRYGGNPRPLCPEELPDPDVPCPVCFAPEIECPYGNVGCVVDGGDRLAIASCPLGTWRIEVRPCDDGGGPDVQGDADADAE